MKKTHVLICAPFLTLPGEPGANRFIALAKRMSKNYQVTLVTSRFCHFNKSQRSQVPDLGPIQVVMLDEPGYQRNVGLGRLWSHRRFCQNLGKFLKTYPKFDLIYSAFPLVRTNLIFGKYFRSKNVPIVIDVQDIWPEAIVGALPALSGRLGQFMMSGLKARSSRAYAMADALVAVSQTYLERADVNGLPEDRKVVAYIGSDKLWFDEQKPIKLRDPSIPLKAVYLGTLGGSYDVETLVRAAALAPSVDIEIIGTGPFEAKLRALNAELGGRAQFTGALSYEEAMSKTVEADVALNAIRSSALQSVTNKLSDYFCAGMPIVSSQTNEEVKKLLLQGSGCTYTAGDASGLASLLLDLSNSPETLRRMALSSREQARNHFLRSKTYQEVIDLVEHVLEEI